MSSTQNFQKLMQTKEEIISLIKSNGPATPIKIASSMGITPLFMSAFLSELYSEKALKMSSMRIGNSPIYYLAGQEALLENFSNYLNSKEREAFLILKESKLLSDEEQIPPIRVALRAIKDFAMPINISSGESESKRLFWKYFLISDEEIKNLLESKIRPKKEEKKIVETKVDAGKNKMADAGNGRDNKSSEHTHENSNEQKYQTNQSNQIPKSDKDITTEFSILIENYLKNKNIEPAEFLAKKKKEVIAKIKIDTIFGKQSYLLTAKDKKKITQDDLTIAIQKAQAEKMPALFLSSGEIDKKASAHLEEWKNLIKFEKLV